MTMHRRTILRGAGSAAIALPLLTSMRSRAGGVVAPKRLVIWFTANGTLQDEWASGGEHDFVLGPVLAPLAAHRDDLLILRGIDMESSYHGPKSGDPHGAGPHVLTGTERVTVGNDETGGGVSVDQFVAQQLAPPTRFASLNFATDPDAGGSNSAVSWHDLGEPVVKELDPKRAFDSCFAEFGQDTTELDKLRTRRESILGFVGDQTRGLQTRLGSDDKLRLDQHLEALRQLEQSIQGLDDLPGACAVPTEPMGIDAGAPDQVPQIGAAFMDVAAMVLACDLARVVTLQWGRPLGGNGRFSWLGHGTNHHDITHNLSVPARRAEKIEIDAWYAAQLASFIDRLEALPEGDGSVFDHTAIVWVNELSDGQAHSRRDMTYLIAGACSGHFATGRMLDFAGTPHNDLLVSLCHAMDVDVQSFGNPAYGSGPLAGLT